MAGSHSDTPAWLFSFVDLAFLILLAMTQLGSMDDQKSINLGEIVVPKIGAEVAAPSRWPSGYAGHRFAYTPRATSCPSFELLVPNGVPSRGSTRTSCASA